MTEAATAIDVGEAPFFGNELTKRQKMTKRMAWLFVAIVIGAIAIMAPQLLRSLPATADQPPPVANVLPVTTLRAERAENYSRQRFYTGLLREARRSQLSFQRGGELLKLSVDEGDKVTLGQSLGELDSRHLRARRAQIQAQVTEAQAVLAELVAGPRQETIAAKRAELRAQESQSQVLSKQLKRRERLLESASVSREEYESFLYDYQAAVARTDVVRRQLDEMLAGTRVEKIAAQRARLAQLDAQLTDLVHDMEDTQLVAPFAGRVAQRLVDEGTVIAAGTSVLELIEDTQLEAWIGVPPQAALALQVGQSVELSVAGESLTAKVQSLAPDVQQSTRTRNVILRLQTSEHTVVPGQMVRLAVTQQVAQAGYWVPTTALTRGTRGLWSVYVVEDNTIARRDVELLDTVGNRSFVRGTLQPGDQVVASGTHRVVLGQRVSVQDSRLAQYQK